MFVLIGSLTSLGYALLIALGNFALGYAIAVYAGRGPRRWREPAESRSE